MFFPRAKFIVIYKLIVHEQFVNIFCEHSDKPKSENRLERRDLPHLPKGNIVYPPKIYFAAFYRKAVPLPEGRDTVKVLEGMSRGNATRRQLTPFIPIGQEPGRPNTTLHGDADDRFSARG